MEELINRVVNSITLAIFGIILWSLIIFLISRLRKKEVKNFNVRALIIFITLTILIFKVINKIKLNFNNLDLFINETWLISSLLVLIYQTTDITYYDGKISLIICILFAGLRTILPVNNFRKET